MSLSRVRSAIALRRRWFSVSRLFRRLTWSDLSPPNSWRQGSRSPLSPQSSERRQQRSGPATPKHQPGAASKQSPRACVSSSASRSSSARKPYLRADHFKGGRSDYWAAFVEQANSTRSAPDVRFENRDLRDMAEEGFRLPEPPDCIIALETMEHVTELDVPKIVDWLARMKVPTLITVPNEVGPALLVKNLGSALMGYRRHREYRIQDTLNAAFGRMERL